MLGRRILLVGIVVALVAASMSAVLLRAGRSEGADRAVYFSVVTGSTTGFKGGNKLAIFGSGTFGSSELEASGIFLIFAGPAPPKDIRASGTFEATDFVSFVSYGSVSPRGEGGQLIMKVKITFDNGDVLQGVTMTVTCLIGSPPSGAEEGVELTGGPLDFETHVAGITQFGAPPE